jgi:hypothetical protein
VVLEIPHLGKRVESAGDALRRVDIGLEPERAEVIFAYPKE